MDKEWTLEEAISYYRAQGAPGDQQALAELLREIQRESGGWLPQEACAEVCRTLGLRESFLSAVIKRYPSLRTEQAPHRLEICGGERCGRNGSASLREFVESTWHVRSGEISREGGFSYRVAGCMKNCLHGPNIRWDGTLYPHADRNLLNSLIGGK